MEPFCQEADYIGVNLILLQLKRSNNETASLRRQENFEDLSKLNDVILANTQSNEFEITAARKSSKKSQGSDKKTIGFNLKETYQTKENNNNNPNTNKEFFNELNASFDHENDDQNDEDQYDDEDYINEAESAGDKMQLKIDDNLSFIEDEDDATDVYVDYEKLHASINQYKFKFLGSVSGMEEFKEFLKNTIGYRLIRFWLDCEFYRDSMQDYDQIENMATRNRLFRFVYFIRIII